MLRTNLQTSRQLQFDGALSKRCGPKSAGTAKLEICIDHARLFVEVTHVDKASGAICQSLLVRPVSGLAGPQVRWELTIPGAGPVKTVSPLHHTSIRARFERSAVGWAVSAADVRIRIIQCAAPESAPEVPSDRLWHWLTREVIAIFDKQAEGMTELAHLARHNGKPATGNDSARIFGDAGKCSLDVCLNMDDGVIDLFWNHTDDSSPLAKTSICCTSVDELTWEQSVGGGAHSWRTGASHEVIRNQIYHLRDLFAVPAAAVTAAIRRIGARAESRASIPAAGSPWDWLIENVEDMAREYSEMYSAQERQRQLLARIIERDEQQHLAEQERLLRRKVEIENERRRREAARLEREQKRAERGAPAKFISPTTGPAKTRQPLPPISLTVAPPALRLQDTLLPLTSLKGYFLREKSAQWWVSNQSDNLLCLPYCRIEKLEYQVRTALRVLGPLRGRALLSDEVGLGKTVEAGLVLKELLTRGMAKRFLVLTVPSLVDQWQEELAEKFGIDVVTTNGSEFRADAVKFWQESRGIVASLHTLKQPAHLAVAQETTWNLLVVDEAHYLRNRTSQAWQAVNALPRQFLLLLTATPVQNSIEELYNLVTLLQPGQLPSPKEFHARFIDAKKPHQPREPDELRRLLGQVMIRNTRANSGVRLPGRRAETVLFAADGAEATFWQQWETDLRKELNSLPANRAMMWGRLLLQAAGSSPAAWEDALRSFPSDVARQR